MPAKRAKKIVRTSLICNSNRQIITVKHANSAGGETTRTVDVGDGTPTINVLLLERVADELLPDDATSKVKLFLQELIFVLHIVNTKSWETDPSMPATFQGHADAMGKLMVEIWGPESITPYFHDIIAGHLRDMMELYGPLYRHQNEGQERFNGRLTGRKKRHSQNSGACNRGAELRASRGATVGKCDSIGTWAGCFALRSSGRADSVLDAATERRRESAATPPPRAGPPPPGPTRRAEVHR
ncbi:hypothetical protein JL721_12116 [Aureococcus anophagefferens]|nr:hypothetical protein JL721_12116 [Aureococcus anophagefferens]